LLLTGEYFVLDGALALAMPTKRGQWLRLNPAPESAASHQWVSKRQDGSVWFEGNFAEFGTLLQSTDQSVGHRLEKLFMGIEDQRPGFWSKQPFWRFETQLEFPREWGLGSSSTLVAALARWADVDPFQLLDATLGGSGYDIACASSHQPILFQRRNGQPNYVSLPYQPSFADQICFVYLGRKQDSREGIKRFRDFATTDRQLQRVSELTLLFLNARDAREAVLVLEEHEALIAESLRLPKVKDQYFSNFPGIVKSLGAWGGDFVMALSEKPATATKQYFKVKGFETALEYHELM
jgi:mevalonate kinase